MTSVLPAWIGTAEVPLLARASIGIGVVGALSLSSTAFALQVLEEKGELTTRHGRLAFAVLLFQDLAAIPLIALVPLFALGAAEPTMDVKTAVIVIGTILGVIGVGRFLLSRLYRIVEAVEDDIALANGRGVETREERGEGGRVGRGIERKPRDRFRPA